MGRKKTEKTAEELLRTMCTILVTTVQRGDTVTVENVALTLEFLRELKKSEEAPSVDLMRVVMKEVRMIKDKFRLQDRLQEKEDEQHIPVALGHNILG